MGDILEALGRSCADVCTHQIPNGEKCTVCNVILYEHDDYMKEATFADLLISSPRRKAPLNRESMEERMRRMDEIIKGLTVESNNPILRQKEYIAANLAKSQAVRSRIVTFKNNANRSREVLFPKLVPERASQSEQSPQTIDHSTGILSLACSDSPTRLRIRIVLPPFGPDSSILVADVDDSVSGRELIDAIVSEEENRLDQSKSYVLRWVEDEEELVPDMDLPPVDSDQPLTSINTNVLCLCDTEYDSEANGSDDSSF